MSNDPFNFRSSTVTTTTTLSSPTNTTITTTVASSSPSGASINNTNKDAEDLHQWSLFRQNLNANFSESVLNHHQHSSTSSSSTNGNSNSSPNSHNNLINSKKSSSKMNGHTGYPLRESTVNNILSHPKYGAQLKNQDAFTYLRFGLPRVKAITNPNGPINDRQPQKNNYNQNQNPDHHHHEENIRITKSPHKDLSNLNGNNISNNVNNNKNGRSGPTSASSAINEELKRRFWSSESNLLHNNSDSTTNTGDSSDSSANGIIKDQQPLTSNHHHHHQHNKSHRHHSPQPPPLTNNKTHNFSSRYNPTSQENRFVSSNNNNRVMPKSSHLTRSSHNLNEHASQTNLNKKSEYHHVHHRRNSSSPPHHHQHSDIEDPPTIPTRISPFNPNHTDNEDDLNLDEPFVPHSSSLPPPMAKHPHLVVKDLMYEVDKSSNWRRMCGFSRQKLRILEDISFDVRGGELMAILATSADEGTALLNVLGARHDHRNGTVRAEIYLNGVLVSPKHLSRLMAYVTQQIHLCSDMSARQALLFAGLLMGPASRSSTDVKRLTRTLLEELNLGEVRHTKLSELTYSEKRRLHIAMHLLLDTELLMIDQPLLGLDIFDSFFMVEYLRQWAMVGGRVVIMTISPPTYEVFTMIHKVLLISAGRPLYVGPRKDFLKYFNSLGYPCPPFKNPSDYYLDLVTVDDLSQEALMESSQRIETLADMHSRRSINEIFSSMPGPPAVLPAPFRRANFAMQFLALWIRALIFSFPYNVVHLFNRFMITIFLSLIIGLIFWQIRTGREQEFVWDRIGFINTMISIGVVPVLVVELVNAHSEKKYILSEVQQGFYSLPAYLLAKLLYTAPQTVLIGLAYALPACSMAGLQLHSNPNALPFYLLLMLSYFLALRSFICASVWICKRRSSAAFLFGFIFTVFLLSSGVNIQYRDISITHRWLRQISPVRWLHEAIVAWEFEPNVISNSDGAIVSSFLCSRNPVIQQPNAILVRADCGFQTRANILKWFEYQGGNLFQPTLRPSWHAFIALLILYIGSFLLGSIIFCLRVYYYRDCPSDTTMASSNTREVIKHR